MMTGLTIRRQCKVGFDNNVKLGSSCIPLFSLCIPLPLRFLIARAAPSHRDHAYVYGYVFLVLSQGPQDLDIHILHQFAGLSPGLVIERSHIRTVVIHCNRGWISFCILSPGSFPYPWYVFSSAVYGSGQSREFLYHTKSTRAPRWPILHHRKPYDLWGSN